MASLITCTPGGASDNCYVTLTQATTYFTSGLREATWKSYAERTREQALIQATQDIERLGGPRATVNSTRRVRFPGSPYLSTIDDQALHFPRVEDTDDDLDGSGNVVKLIPQAVQEAVCEQAFWLLQQQASPALLDTDDLRARGVQFMMADGVSINLRESGIPAGICPEAWERIQPFVRRGFATSAGPVAHVSHHRGRY